MPYLDRKTSLVYRPLERYESPMRNSLTTGCLAFSLFILAIALFLFVVSGGYLLWM